MIELTAELKDEAHRLGFCLVGVAPALEADGFDRYLKWLDDHHHGQMAYMSKRPENRREPRAMLEGVKCVVMVGMEDVATARKNNPSSAPPFEGGELSCPLLSPLPPGERRPELKSQVRMTNDETLTSNPSPAKPGEGRRNYGKIARYAVGPDYHEVIWRKLDELQVWLQERMPGCRTRGVCDTAPLLERDFARRAGLGWIGKNTMLINKRRGSYVMLGAMLTDVELRPDQPHEAQHCGTCTRCLEECPTDAFPEPGVLDARKCISYLTIEVKGPLSAEEKNMVGDWLFGCDICQDVCPWNRKSVEETEQWDAREILALSTQEFRNRFRTSALHRRKRPGLARNAAIVLGTTGDASALPWLHNALDDDDAGVRDAAAWAIEQITHRQSDFRAPISPTHP